jgi:hypothetical protein
MLITSSVCHLHRTCIESLVTALHKYHHPEPNTPEYDPHTWNPPLYGEKTQRMPPLDLDQHAPLPPIKSQ